MLKPVILILNISNHISAMDTFSHIKKYIKKTDHVLDFGTGEGYVAAQIEKFGAKVTKLDIENFTADGSPVVLFDGVHAPFADKSFDVSVCTFVLHHAEDQDGVIKELKRLTSKYIIVSEDVVNTGLDKFLSWTHSQYSKLRYHSKEMSFKSAEEWKDFFIKHGLKVVAESKMSRKVRSPLYPIHRRTFVLATN